MPTPKATPKFSREFIRQWPLHGNYSMTTFAKWPLHENYSMTNSAQWPLHEKYFVHSTSYFKLLGAGMGVGLGVGTAALEPTHYQRDKSQVSRVQGMFYAIYARAYT